ncbi:helix-turn-helix domain-containing protein [Isoptericola sp. BMS4]|uniref:AraC-like ligand-binding domain-containing protein n=1 Tax=Isoptericola sp. BMS4 TaxID=2527875 RepID=UPI00142375D4|nr:helix-turn-helix domain-containing protein [Isoptericola sp. BMS4]
MPALLRPDGAATAPAQPVQTAAHGISEFRAAVDASFVPLHVTSHRPDHFRGVLRATVVDDVHVTELRATPHAVERTPELVARDDRPFLKVSLMLAGSALLVQDGREAVLSPGDLAVYDTGRPYSLEFDENIRTTVLMFPRHALGVPPGLVDGLTAVRVPGSHGPGSMVSPYLAHLAANLDQLGGTTGERLVRSAVDLVSTVLMGELGLEADAEDPHRVLVQRIHRYIDRNLASPDLSPGTIAAAHFISTRHLHGLFHDRGTTVSTWIRERRLEQCRRSLADPSQQDRPVAAIAARWGFVDAAHFSRTFKAAYGVSPSRYRTTH